MIRIATAGFQHESNTFSSVPASLDKFRRSGILEGDAIRNEYATSQTTLAGFFAAAAEDPEVELTPLVFTRLTPMGAITHEAIGHIMDRVVAAIRDQGPWDAVLLPQHGAAVSETWPDADGELVRRVRETVGPGVPIGLALDMHANVSRQMVENADVTTVYQTNPHIDAFEQALLCARLVLRMVRGEIRPRTALRTPPLLVNILCQGTSDAPMSDLLRIADQQRRRPGVLSVSVVEGYPYADVAEMGMSFIAVTDDDMALADDVAGTLAEAAWAMRAALNTGGTPIDAALMRARAAPAGPVVLFDVGDNVGGGSPGDSTLILHAARRLGIAGLLQALGDPAAVRACAEAGVGGRIALAMGGKTDDRHGAPFAISGAVTALSDGRYEETGPTHGGFRFFNDGPSAAVRTDDGYTLVLTTHGGGSASLQQFRTLGIEPRDAKIIVAKGVHSPRPAMEPIARELIWVATPGVTTADLSTFTYRRRRVPLYPLEPAAECQAAEDAARGKEAGGRQHQRRI
ncbi:M81 family metallopeptidase [Limobrevibacterium gyesilva]|uniref:Microcystinase C n=1 Tax=Limobrevibacterium gyesilva TaxID=2991712 RepID=A0AA41YIX7_9PROT|nr:M81 family metallopeptidase [Limobrevibacterium gyesilva]MCW3473979.1 M81 family metallopeptidase [Limobrevibacterium gyesilva]